jgi:hypothetical protein
MRYFAAIERFLEKDIQKNALPEGLGEGPEYKVASPRKNSRGRGGRKRSGKGNGKNSGKGNGKGNGKGQRKEQKKVK